MGTKDKERRVYPKKFKVETVALAEKHEKPVRQIAVDLGVVETAFANREGLIFHSDQGYSIARKPFGKLWGERCLSVRRSMSRKGNWKLWTANILWGSKTIGVHIY
ncbi:MAG: hypothetical protein LBB98_06625 [Treponema sp.]|jgi:hypothetical protein|nr:hypothetical protein [Treponema sp.]